MQSRVVPRPGIDYYFVYISTPSSSRAKAIQTREYRGGAAQFSRDLHRAAASIAPPSLVGEGPPPSPSLVSGRRVIPLDLGSPHRRRPSSPGALSLDPRASGLPRARLRPPPPPWPPSPATATATVRPPSPATATVSGHRHRLGHRLGEWHCSFDLV